MENDKADLQEDGAKLLTKKERAAQAFRELVERRQRQREYWLKRKAERHGLVYVPKEK